jgi:cyanamide hydratase
MLVHAFPEWTSITEESTFLETYALACLLHDIGTTDQHLEETLLSFEFYGGFVAEGVLREKGVVREMRDAVVESVIRHQDLGEVGTQTRVGGLLQLATIFGRLVFCCCEGKEKDG